MCSILSKHFTKSGITEWGNCNVTVSDSVRAEAIVSFSGAELNKQYYCWITVKHPSGTMYDYKTATLTAYGTETFTTDILPLSTGTFSVIVVNVYDTSPALVCYG